MATFYHPGHLHLVEKCNHKWTGLPFITRYNLNLLTSSSVMSNFWHQRSISFSTYGLSLCLILMPLAWWRIIRSYMHWLTCLPLVTYLGNVWRPFFDKNNASPWKQKAYEVWYYNPNIVVSNMLANPNFNGQFDVHPYINLDEHQKRRWSNVMSLNIAWQCSVSRTLSNPWDTTSIVQTDKIQRWGSNLPMLTLLLRIAMPQPTARMFASKSTPLWTYCILLVARIQIIENSSTLWWLAGLELKKIHSA